MNAIRPIFATAILLIASVNVSSAAIVADYTHDTFFAGNALAKAALEKAISDLNNVITSNLTAITPAQDAIVGTNSPSTATINHAFTYTNPTTGATGVSFNGGITALPANEIRIFVGMQNLTGNTLGQGGPGSIGFSVSGFPNGNSAAFSGAITSAATQSTSVYRRGGAGPIIATLGTTINFGGIPTPISIDYGNSIGNLWFDQDTNNDGIADDAGTLDSFWNFDANATSFGTKADFYSVALHETLHAIGFGTSDSWDALVSASTNWTGVNAIAANGGSGAGLIDGPSGAHVASGILSPRLSDGLLQETVMSPSILLGARKTLTALDVAFLQDIGFSVAAVPEPGSLALIGIGVLGYGVLRRRRAA